MGPAVRALLAPLLLASTLALPVPQAAAAGAPQVLATGRAVPWGLAFLPDGSALFTERDTARVWAVTPGRPARHIYTVSEARPAGEGGLLGVAVAPDYARNPRFFVYYTTGTDNRIAYVRRGSAARPVPIVTGIPRGRTHNGGRLVFDRAGLLYAGTGDAGDRRTSQDTRSLGGKVLRVTASGAAAPGNRFGRVFTYGHRNVQGLVFDRAGRLWATELGQDAQDELNLLQEGRNYGWPLVEGRGGDGRFADPAWTWRPAQASPSGVAVRGDSLYVAALRGQRVWRLRLAGATVTGATSLYAGRFGRLRTIGQNPRDGAVWLTTSNTGSSAARRGDDRVLRIPSFP